MDVHPFPIFAVVLVMATLAVGPVGVGWVSADGTIELLADFGIALLLFLVGLRLDVHMIRSTGRWSPG